MEKTNTGENKLTYTTNNKQVRQCQIQEESEVKVIVARETVRLERERKRARVQTPTQCEIKTVNQRIYHFLFSINHSPITIVSRQVR